MVLMITWDYPNSAPVYREVPYGLGYMLGFKGCAYKVQLVSLENSIVLEEFKHDF